MKSEVIILWLLAAIEENSQDAEGGGRGGGLRAEVESSPIIDRVKLLKSQFHSNYFLKQSKSKIGMF